MSDEPMVFVDMDGVLTDFTESAIELVTGVDRRVIMRGWPSGEYDLPRGLGIKPEAFWRKISEAGSRFWRELKPYSWSLELYRRLGTDVGKCVVLSSPTLDPACIEGKLRWLQRVFQARERFRDYIFAPSEQKYLLAGRHRILIDDSVENVRSWENAGGRAVLVPQPWNDGAPILPCQMVDKLLCRALNLMRSPWEPVCARISSI